MSRILCTVTFEPGGAVSFHHHDLVGAKLAKKRLTALRFDKATIDSVARLIELHLRFFGYSFNPVSFYYVFDATDSRVETIVAEITNTPWKERHAYVLPATDAARRGARAWHFSFDKQFHVSPFNPMDMRYDWRFSALENGLHVHM